MPELDFSVLDFDLPGAPDEVAELASEKPIYTLDCETPPFEHGVMVRPFAWGWYDGQDFEYRWGDDCTAQIEELILSKPPGIIYMHNGGKFDIYYLIRLIFGRAFIVNRRIVKARIALAEGHHEVRDSYAIMPFPLREFDKGEIDYEKHRAENREVYKAEILTYLTRDCTSLHRLVTEFWNRFGNNLTIGGLAMKELKKFHPFESSGVYHDADIRRHFYYGGRVQCFQRGILKGPWNVYDVNSMFPSVMRNLEHPMEMPGAETARVRKDTCFVTVEGKNFGAFPQRTKHDGLRFDVEEGIFHVTRHEFDAAIDLGIFKPRRIIRCVNYHNRATLAEFVDTYYHLRKQAKDSGDPFGTIFYKYILNSAYGKFAQNPEKYAEWEIGAIDSEEPKRGRNKLAAWTEGIIGTHPEFAFKIWTRPVPDRTRYNIAVGASITGAARALLMRAIAKADTPIYCDTDSLICRKLGDDAVIDPLILGAWKLEIESADVAYVAMRKMYALMKGPGDGREGPPACLKLATKGVRIGPHDIEDVCKGKTVLYRQNAPTFRLDGSVVFMKREVKMA